jgi:hypothetical protein
MHTSSIAIVVTVLAAGATAASEKTDVMVPVRQFVEGFNKHDAKMAVAACAEQTSIIDDLPPHEWHGVGACSKWMNDFDADAKKNEITEAVVALSKPRHIDITADHAYVVASANYTFKEKGKPNEETGSIITMALQKGETGWQITGWAWAKR